MGNACEATIVGLKESLVHSESVWSCCEGAVRRSELSIITCAGTGSRHLKKKKDRTNPKWLDPGATSANLRADRYREESNHGIRNGLEKDVNHRVIAEFSEIQRVS